MRRSYRYFVDPVKLELFAVAPLVEREDYYCYVGRLSQEKGVATLLRAASQLPYKLKIAGDGPIGNDLRNKYADCKNIEFLGHCNADEVSRLISNARFSVIPSECYENNPLSVIESLCGGTPVIGADMGGIPELISANSGIIFRSGDENSLQNAIDKAWKTEWDNSEIKANSLSRFSPMSHYCELLKIYNQ